MEMMRCGRYDVCFYLDEEFLNKYGLSVDVFRNHQSFPDAIIADLLRMANAKYGIGFDVDNDTPIEIDIVAGEVKMGFRKSNIIHLETDETEELEICKGIREIIRLTPDEKICMEPMEVNKKHELLEQIRNDDDFTYIRENFITYDDLFTP